MAKWWTCVLVTLALAMSGFGGREASSTTTDGDALTAFRACRLIYPAKRTSSLIRDARVQTKSGHAPVIVGQPFAHGGPDLVVVAEQAAHPGSDLGQSSATRHGARAPPRG